MYVCVLVSVRTFSDIITDLVRISAFYDHNVVLMRRSIVWVQFGSTEAVN